MIDGLGTIDYKKLDEELREVFNTNYSFINENEEDANEWIIKIENQKYNIAKNGNVTKIGMANNITAENYGDYINYGIDLNGDGDLLFKLYPYFHKCIK